MQAIIAIFFLGVVGIVVFIAYNIWLGISPTERARELKQRQETWDKAQGDLALTCDRCGERSPPIPDTGNRYRCEKCNRQFAGARHNQYSRPTTA
jgi:hypothetical protein